MRREIENYERQQLRDKGGRRLPGCCCSTHTVLLPPVTGILELGKFPGWAGRGFLGAHSCCCRAWLGELAGMLWGCVWEGRRQVAWGSRKEAGNGGSLSSERVKFLA